MDIDETESDENVQERVPFKVVEELSRVKTYLNRKDRKYDGCSTDSGYRSDSQHRNSLRSASQPSGGWLNQSAHCLYSHIMQATPTDDIVKEISQVLGKLIDKLHEEENYPPFLEELLETVDRMLRDIHTDGCTDNLILNKDEKIQRMILVNKSKHILKYSIEKITAILQQLHTNLTQENPYECTNIVDLENICYIFHMLEIFLKRYKKVKDSNQSQNSQDTLPKRSSLAELWRKKWNPNSKEIVKHENKICVLKGCSEILNKIIVECMNGYSLVSYAALQCFNLIQD
ncbi:uncharacterized protein LOC133532774 [Cydia pomonella]|uniref:uncharacterized protein LOC133532774 n=1 Tax=Cydia pomonella TaxID=82600 RepID=UPI002ADE2E8B|nr:uncharacterized protein LOC133532774 [Cydia pomonella]